MHGAFADERASDSANEIMPAPRPLSSAAGSWKVLPSAMRRATAGVLSSTSRAATRPPRSFRSSTCDTTPRRLAASDACTFSRRSAGNSSISRSMADAVEGRAPTRTRAGRTRRRRSRASRAPGSGRPRSASTSGSSRKAALTAETIASSPRTSRWLMNERFGSCTKSICDFGGDHMVAAGAVDEIDERREQRRLAAAAHAGHQDQAVSLGAERLHFRRQRRAGRPQSPAPGPCGRSRRGRDDRGT